MNLPIHGPFSLIKFIISVLKPFKHLIACQFFVAMAWAIDLSLRPYLLKQLINRIPHLVPEKAFENLGSLAIGYISLSALIVIIFRFYDVAWLHLKPNLKRYVNVRLTSIMMSHSHRLYQNHFAGGLANKINNVVNGIPQLLKISVDKFFSHFCALIIAVYTLSLISTKFAFALIVWVLVFIVTSLAFSRKSQVLAQVAAEANSIGFGNLVDILSNIMSVRLFSTKREEANRFDDVLKLGVTADQRKERFMLMLFALQGGSFTLYQAICLWWLILGLKAQTVTAGDFVLILTLNISIVDCLWSFAKDVRDFIEALGNVKEGLSLVYLPPDVQDKQKVTPLILTNGQIIFDHVTFGYEGAPTLFQDLCLTIKPGERVGIVGYSGGGKSTLINLLLRLFDVVGGRILLDNQDIRDVAQDDLRQAISMVPQDPALFHRSLMENIRYGRLSATDEEVIEASKKAHTHEFIIRLEEGYASLVGERGVKLSGGQRQRIALARAFLKNGAFLICDEATSHLDSLTENYIQESLEALMKGKTTLIIAHRLFTLRHVDRILVLDRGQIIEEGAHEHLIKKEGLYSKMWNTQVDGFLGDQKDL